MTDAKEIPCETCERCGCFFRAETFYHCPQCVAAICDTAGFFLIKPSESVV